MPKIERVWHHHDKWEDYKAGQYALRYDNEMVGAGLATDLLRDPDGLWAAMSAVIREWPHATAVNLSHTSQNRQAWLGQAACCWNHGVPDFVTKQGWHQLTQDEQNQANDIADSVIAEWEVSQTDAETLFRD